MNSEDTVEPQVQDQVVIETQQDQLEANLEPEVAEMQEKQVPLSALQKERRKRQELELELQYARESQQKASREPDDSQYEPVTRADLGHTTNEILRQVEEKTWIRHNPEKYQKLNENLEQFLKQKPHLAEALKHAPNRWEEAWELMNALTPKQQQQLKAPPVKRDAPGSPSGVPKAAAINQAVDVMSMSDAEYTTWRQSQKKRR